MKRSAYLAGFMFVFALLLAFSMTPVVAQMSGSATEQSASSLKSQDETMRSESDFAGEAKAGATTGDKERSEMKTDQKSKVETGAATDHKAGATSATKTDMDMKAKAGDTDAKVKADMDMKAKAGDTDAKAKADTDMKARVGDKEKTGAFTDQKSNVDRDMKSGKDMRSKMDTEGKADVSTDPRLRTPGATSTSPDMRPGMRGETRGEFRDRPAAQAPDAAPRGEFRDRPAAQAPDAAPRGDMPARAQGGQAFVARVDQPDNCLRVRKEPNSSAEMMACLAEGETLNLTGVFSEDKRWAQLDNEGWVFFSQLKTDVKPMEGAYDRPAATGDRSSESFDRPAAAAGKGVRGKFHGRGYGHGQCYWGFHHPGYYGNWGYHHFPRQQSSMYWDPWY